jgi:uncharacterized membrane protein
MSINNWVAPNKLMDAMTVVTTLKTEKRQLMRSETFRVLGIVLIIVGLIVTVKVADSVTSGFFSSSRHLSGKAAIMILLTAFYHFVSAMLCFGVASILAPQKQNEAFYSIPRDAGDNK